MALNHFLFLHILAFLCNLILLILHSQYVDKKTLVRRLKDHSSLQEFLQVFLVLVAQIVLLLAPFQEHPYFLIIRDFPIAKFRADIWVHFLALPIRPQMAQSARKVFACQLFHDNLLLKQAAREGGQILITQKGAAGLSALTGNLLFLKKVPLPILQTLTGPL